MYGDHPYFQIFENLRDAGSEANFSSAMSRYYNDTIKLTGAIQLIPKFMQRLVSLLKACSSSV